MDKPSEANWYQAANYPNIPGMSTNPYQYPTSPAAPLLPYPQPQVMSVSPNGIQSQLGSFLAISAMLSIQDQVIPPRLRRPP